MSDEYSPSKFFRTLSRAFDETIMARRHETDLVGQLCAQAVFLL